MTVYSRNGVLVSEEMAKAIDEGRAEAPASPEDTNKIDLQNPEYFLRAADCLAANGFTALANAFREEFGGQVHLPPNIPQNPQPVIAPVVASQLAVTPVVVPPIPMGGTEPGGTPGDSNGQS